MDLLDLCEDLKVILLGVVSRVVVTAAERDPLQLVLQSGRQQSTRQHRHRQQHHGLHDPRAGGATAGRTGRAPQTAGRRVAAARQL